MIKIVKGKLEEIDEYMSIYDTARNFMIEHNNETQWPKDYPSKDTILQDISNGNFYVLKNDDVIQCVFTFIKGIDQTYLNIYDGERINNSEYYTIHRIASSFKSKGTFHSIINWCKNITRHIRIDTHEKNEPMKGAILKEGFKYCGIIHIENGEERLAFELII